MYARVTCRRAGYHFADEWKYIESQETYLAADGEDAAGDTVVTPIELDTQGTIMDRSRELNDFSVTVTVSNTHVPEQWFVAYALFLDQVIFRTGGTGFVAQETGRRKQQVHLQSGIRARAAGTTGAKELHDYLCEHVCLWVAGRKLRVTPYGPGQNMLAMAGYCMKDKGKSHYRFHSVNFTTSDLDRAMRQYALVRTSYEDGKRMLSKRNAMTMAWKEVRSYPLRVLFHLPSRAICSPGQARLDPSVHALCSRPFSHSHVYASTLCHCLSLCLPVEPLLIPRLAWPTRHSDVADTIRRIYVCSRLAAARRRRLSNEKSYVYVETGLLP